jgi:nitroreductase
MNSAATSTINPQQSNHYFADAARDAVYQAIFSRRDVRGQFLPDAIPDEVLARILTAAHFAPSVGYMQPWSFVLIRDAAVKQRIHTAFAEANAEALQMFEGEKREIYRELKLEGIIESPVNILITCDRDRAGPVVIGRTHINMPLVSMRQLLDHAAENGYGLPAFNVNNMEQVWAIMEAASRNSTPGHHAGLGRRPQIRRRSLPAPPDPGRARSLSAHPGRHAPGPRPEPGDLHGAIRSGFSSVMMDGSLGSRRQDHRVLRIQRRRHAQKWSKFSHAIGVSVEAELGVLGSLETMKGDKEDGHGAEGT